MKYGFLERVELLMIKKLEAVFYAIKNKGIK